MSQPEPEVRLDLEQVDAAASRDHGFHRLPRTRPSDLIEALINGIGGVINWIWLLLVLIIVINVVGRYLFGVNYVWVEEVQWHLYAVGFMLGIGYALQHDTHVRVDVVAMHLSSKVRGWIEVMGLLLLVAPVVYLIIRYAIPFVEVSWTRNERSSAPGGLSHRWAIKSVIIIAFVYLGLAALARLLRLFAFLIGWPRPRSGA